MVVVVVKGTSKRHSEPGGRAIVRDSLGVSSLSGRSFVASLRPRPGSDIVAGDVEKGESDTESDTWTDVCRGMLFVKNGKEAFSLDFEMEFHSSCSAGSVRGTIRDQALAFSTSHSLLSSRTLYLGTK